MPRKSKSHRPTRPVPKDEEFSRKEKFLISFRKWGLRSKALQEADISLSTFKKWLEKDSVFREKYDLISEEVSIERQDILEEAAFSRALTRSDVLMKLLLQYFDPGYRDKAETMHSGQVRVNIKESTEDGGDLDLSGL